MNPRVVLRNYVVKNPKEFPLLVRRLEADKRTGEQFLADFLGPRERVGAFRAMYDKLRLANDAYAKLDALARHRLIDSLIRYLYLNPEPRPDAELLPRERLAERVREVRGDTEETILDLAESLFRYYDIIKKKEEEEAKKAEAEKAESEKFYKEEEDKAKAEKAKAEKLYAEAKKAEAEAEKLYEEEKAEAEKVDPEEVDEEEEKVDPEEEKVDPEEEKVDPEEEAAREIILYEIQRLLGKRPRDTSSESLLAKRPRDTSSESLLAKRPLYTSADPRLAKRPRAMTGTLDDSF